jgi:hypothetical protein
MDIGTRYNRGRCDYFDSCDRQHRSSRYRTVEHSRHHALIGVDVVFELGTDPGAAATSALVGWPSSRSSQSISHRVARVPPVRP